MLYAAAMLAPRVHPRSGPPKRLRKLAAALALGALFLIALQAASASAGAPRTSGKLVGGGRLYALEPQVFAAINDLRRAQGLAPLRMSRALSLAADEHSLSMAEHGYFEHSSLDGSPFSRRVVALYAPGKRRWSVGENLVWASPGLSARRVLDLWLASPPHRATLLSPTWRDVGLGAIRAVAGGVYGGRVVTILTADFGVRG